MSTIVGIVGRPNVGKSTLFNRLTETRSAIVDESSGVTRDRHYGHAEWIGKQFSVIDTGGYVRGSDDEFEDMIREQVEFAVEESDILLFVVDASDAAFRSQLEVTQAVLAEVGATEVPRLLILNKRDNLNDDQQAVLKTEFPDAIMISTRSKEDVQGLRDKIMSYFESNMLDED